MPTKKELTDAYAEALKDHAQNTPFVVFHPPNEIGKTIKGRLTKHNNNFYVKTIAHFYLVEDKKKIQEIFESDRNVEFNFKPTQAKLNGITVNATIIN